MAKNVISLVIDGDSKGALAALAKTDDGIKGFVAKLRSSSKTTGVLMAAGVAAGAVEVTKQLYDLGSKFDEQYDKIRVASGTTGTALGGLKQVFKDVLTDVPTDFGKAGDAVSQLSQRIGEATNGQLRTMADRFLELSRLTGTDLSNNIKNVEDAFKSWGVSVEKQPKYLDLLFRASQVSGQSVADLGSNLAANGLVLRTVGFSFQDATALLAALGQAGVDVSDIMPALSKSLAYSAKEGKTAKQGFEEIFYAIKNAPDDVSAAGVALQDLGAKAGPKLAALIREGKFSYQDFSAAISKGDSITKAAKNTDDFGESWKRFKNTLLVEIEPIATKVFDGINVAMQWLVDHKEDFQKAFEDIGRVIQAVWAVVGPIYEAMGTTFLAILNLIDDLIHGRWGQIWDDFVTVVKDTLLSLAAPALAIFHLFDGVFADIGNAALDGVNTVVNWFAELPERIQDAIRDLADKLYEAGRNAIKSFIHGFTSIDVPSIHIPGTSLSDYDPRKWFASGGAIPGPLGAPLPIVAHGGEVMLNASQVQALGSGAVLGKFASGGPSTGGGVDTINVVVQMDGVTVAERLLRLKNQGYAGPWN